MPWHPSPIEWIHVRTYSDPSFPHFYFFLWRNLNLNLNLSLFFCFHNATDTTYDGEYRSISTPTSCLNMHAYQLDRQARSWLAGWSSVVIMLCYVIFLRGSLFKSRYGWNERSEYGKHAEYGRYTYTYMYTQTVLVVVSTGHAPRQCSSLNAALLLLFEDGFLPS